ncbi:TIGR03086 family protein [Actinoplanes derwentensis]|uniref:TIGR03086 family protein n=1 Tax=Actinoplanes derwentensis TaxID=113562 RepID=A0A1H2CE52_9ACTN|nr:TIGR03086 family metal-binding protein [Actinoplanes derwentensis]GID87358.1 TIGR03086 family protein [Actinoplanes derwentensis]SDT68396.1 TIGR03086 family protein [Actinoplanes derwentensis]
MADRVPLDFDPPVRQIRALLLGVDNRDLAGPTPCPDWPVAALLDHLMGLVLAFTLAARKRAGADGRPRPSAAGLSPHWRSRLPVLLADLAIAWKDQAAWTGTALAGGVTMPATTMGVVAMNELVVHGWDLARATGQDFAADPRVLEALVDFLEQGPAEGTPGLFGPRVPVDPQEELLLQTVALAGRDPFWRRPRHHPSAA